jgi:very-short-patch-repair endonuclease
MLFLTCAGLTLSSFANRVNDFDVLPPHRSGRGTSKIPLTIERTFYNLRGKGCQANFLYFSSPLAGEDQGEGELMNSTSTIAKKLRKRQTEAEKRLWRHLKAKQLEGVKFRRQEPFGKYIVDFASFDRKLVIELDGGRHADEMRDAGRDAWLGTQGFKVLRFWNNEIFENFDGVLEEIRRRVVSHPPPAPPIQGGGSTTRKKGD